MYQSNLSYTLLKNVLDDLVNQELISEIDQTLKKRKRDKRTNMMYEITSKGQNVLKYFNNAKGLLQIEDSNLRPYQVSN